MQNPLVIFVGAAVATLAALLGVTYDKWSPEQGIATGIVATSPIIESATAPASGSPGASTTTDTTGQAAAPATQAETTELAAIDPQSTTAPSSAAPTGPESAVDDSVPTFDTIRVETDGSTVMAGRGMPSADVTVMLDGQALGTTKTDGGGAWVFVPEEPLPAGDHDLTLRMQMANAEPVDSHQSVALKVPEHGGDEALVVLNDPNQASKVLQKPPVADVGQESSTAQAAPASKKVEVASANPSVGESATVPLQTANTPLSLNTVDYNDAGDIIFSGQAPAGTSVRLYVDNKSVGDAKVDATGAWTFAGRNQIQPGTHTLRIDQLATGAKVAQRIELPFVRAEPQEVAALMQSTAEPPIAEPPTVEQPAAAEQPAATESSAAAEPSAPAATDNEAQTTTTAAAESPQAPAVEPPAAAASATPTTADATAVASSAPPAVVEPAQPAADAPPSEAAAMTSEDLAPAEIADPTTPEAAEPSQATDSTVAAAAPAAAATQATGADVAGTPEPSTATATEAPASAEPSTTADAQLTTPPAEETAAAPAPAEETVASSAPAAQEQSATELSPRNGRVVIQPGNNLWRISRVIYGQGVRYTIIYQANKDQIRNPHLIYPGQIFATPGVSPPERIDPAQRTPLESETGSTTSG